MKSILFVIAVLFSSMTFSQTNAKKALKFDNVEIIRNDIPYDAKEMFVFNFTNKTGQTVTVTNVQTSCGCTAAEKPENPIKKNKKGKISVTYVTIRVGYLVKTITVTADNAPAVVLTIRGNVLPQKP